MAGILKQAETISAPPEAPAEEAPPAAPPAGMSTESMPPEQGGEAPDGVDDSQMEDAPERMPGQEDADPEEQEQFERARAVGLKLLSAKGALDRLIATVKKGGLNGIAEMISMFVARIDEKMDLPETVILPLATEMTGFVLEAVERAKVAKVDEASTQKVMSSVYQALATVYGQTSADAAEAIKEMEVASGNSARGA